MIAESAYNQEVAAAFKRILAAADQIDPDVLEADATPDMVTLTSSKGEKCIVNTQRAVRQIWVASRSQGIHFRHHDDGRWLDDKDKGLELFAFVSDAVKDLTGQGLTYP